MITDNNKWHYLALKCILNEQGFVKPTQSISRLFNNITSTNLTTEYYCLNCLKSYRSENTLKEHEKICENNDYCEIVMPDEDNKILRHRKGTKCIKMEYVIYLDLECILTKHDTCANNLNNSYSKTLSTHEASGYSLLVVSKHSDNQQLHYKGIHCMERLSSELMTIGKEIANKKKSEEQLLTQEEENDYEKSENCDLYKTKYSSKEEIDNLKKEIDKLENDKEDREGKCRIT